MVKFTYGGKDYTLGFNRKTAEMLQRQGFNVDEIDTKPLVQIPLLFRGAFAMNHRSVKNEKIDEIYEKIGDKTGLLSVLVKDYYSTFETLFNGGDDEGDENSDFIKWSND